jgi:hypothetical protein
LCIFLKCRKTAKKSEYPCSAIDIFPKWIFTDPIREMLSFDTTFNTWTSIIVPGPDYPEIWNEDYFPFGLCGMGFAASPDGLIYSFGGMTTRECPRCEPAIALHVELHFE